MNKHLVAALFLFSLSPVSAAPGDEAIDLAKAPERGVFNIGPARGDIRPFSDPKIGKEVLEFHYEAPAGSVVGVWSKGYPAPSDPARAAVARIRVRSSETPQGTVHVELKGSRDVQTIPVPVKAAWTSGDETVDWEKIGELKEIVFVVTPPENRSASGTLYLDIHLAPKPPSQGKQAVPAAFTLHDAEENGVFTMGASQGTLEPAADPVTGRRAMKFDYRAPRGSAVGLWTKSYPASLSKSSVNSVKIGVRPIRPDQAGKVTVTVELKGTRVTQSVPVPLQSGHSLVEERLDWSKIGELKEVVFVVSPLGEKTAAGTLFLEAEFLKIVVPRTTAAVGTPTSFNLLGAQESGVFNMGESEGKTKTVFDPSLRKEVLELAYVAPADSAVGVWTKNFPASLGPATANAVQIDVWAEPGKERSAAVTLEIKGSRVTQSLPVELGPGWISSQKIVNWDMVGDLKEVVFVVTPKDGAASGTLRFNLDFLHLTSLPNPPPAPASPLGGKLILLAGLSLLLTAGATVLKRRRPAGGAEAVSVPKETRSSFFSEIKRDLAFGAVVVLLLSAALYIHTVAPSAGPADLGFLAVAFAGVLATEMLKYLLTGRHLTPVEVLQNFFFSGLLAVSSSHQALWHAPGHWTEIVQKSRLTASLTFLIYHAINASILASAGNHLRLSAGSLLVGAPYLFGWLLTLENPALLQSFSGLFTLGSLDAWPAIREVSGRFLVVLAFNQAVAHGISWTTKGKPLRAPRAHMLTLVVSLAVVLSPRIADWGSVPAVGHLPILARSFVAVGTAMLSQAGLWMEVYLITGMILDGVYGAAPSWSSVSNHVRTGLGKGMVYSGIFMAILYVLRIVFSAPLFQALSSAAPLFTGAAFGAAVFPFAKAVIESFDGSQRFLDRVRFSYAKGPLYARGAVAGLAVAFGLTNGLIQASTGNRMAFGLLAGLLAGAGISLVRDAFYKSRGRGHIGSHRLYLIDAALGGFIGAALAFYMDASQVPVVVEKFRLYTSAGWEPKDYTIYALLSKWGRVDLGATAGGVKLLFNEALAGVITWSIAAWLFAVNRVFLTAYFQRDKAPITHFFSKAGFIDLSVNMIHVLRWGLWMSPIINTGLRMMGEATWYNQDGLIRTVVATVADLTLNDQEFQSWSLRLFISLLAFDIVRILIWIDHMGLRVATLVNLSFIGLDKLDEKIARFLGPAATQRYIPEGVKRFTTWAPLLIPFYIPRGAEWDYAWETSQAMLNAPKESGPLANLATMPAGQLLFLAVLATAGAAGLSFLIRAVRRRRAERRERDMDLSNREYRVVLKPSGEIYSEVTQRGHDVTRRAYDPMHPAGRALFLVDAYEGAGSAARAWPVVGNFPSDRFGSPRRERGESSLRLVHERNGLRASVEIRLPDPDAPAELWTISVENLSEKTRELKIVPYLEWVLDRPGADKGHTQYNRLFPEMGYESELNAVIAWSKHAKSAGFLACDSAPTGFLTSRMDFIGRARSLWSPRALETLPFLEARDTDGYPTFDPIASLLLGAVLKPGESHTVRLLLGACRTQDAARETVRALLKPEAVKAPSSGKKRSPLIGHGEIPPGTPQPYSTYEDDGNRLKVLTPYTPRPYDHAMANAVGHYVMVTNRGLHLSASGNSQQNPITPDWPDTVTREVPAEAIYLFDPQNSEWLSPTLHPVNNHAAKHESEFGVDGTALFRMSLGEISTELTVFVPPDEPLGLYVLTVKNKGKNARKLRVAPYFQFVLASSAEPRHGPLMVRRDDALDALFFRNPRNAFRPGEAFASLSIKAEQAVTRRSQFFGPGRGPDRPYFVEHGAPAEPGSGEDRPVAGFLGTIDVPPGGESTVVIVLGQTDDKTQAENLIRKYKDAGFASKSLEATRRWWLGLMGTARVETNSPDVNRLQNWLKYQAVAERLWGRRGFYQTSGAFGFRDQLQDTVNLVWVDPALARKQLILHASQQFPEGDVTHWFHTLHDGRTAFANRSQAYDNLLWLPWGVGEYVKSTGDKSILNEMTSYLISENPFPNLPENKHGWGAIYLRSTIEDSVYRHCMKAVDLVLEKRMGRNGIPLIGTGDWNDGLDEIGSKGRGESVWLGLFLVYILKNLFDVIGEKDGPGRRAYYESRVKDLVDALERTWRDDRYLRAIHDDGTEIGLKGSGVWEIDALTAAWAVMAGINFERGVTVFETALRVLEKENVILLGWPALREDTKPFLGRSSHYPEGVRENGMYCHGDQWLIGAARVLAEEFEKRGDKAKAKKYRADAYRLWRKVAPVSHVTPEEIELYGGQPNKQAADLLTTFDQGRMIWHGYTGAAGWMLRQTFEGVAGAKLKDNEVVPPSDLNEPRGDLQVSAIRRNIGASPFAGEFSSHSGNGKSPAASFPVDGKPSKEPLRR